MKEVHFTVQDPLGLHARPAGMLVKLAQSFKSEGMLTLERTGKTASIKRLLAIMGLGVKGGDSIALLIQGEDEDAAAAALENWIQENLG